MSTSSQRASSTRSPRSTLAAADATLGSRTRAAAADTPLGATTLELAAAAPEASNDDATLDGVLNGWGECTAREQLRWQLAALNAVLQGAQQLREAQAEFGRQMQQSLEQLGQQFQDARNLSDLASVQARLSQGDLKDVLQLGNRLAQLGTDQWLQLSQETSKALVRLQSTYWGAALNWFRLQTQLGGDSEMIEAEVEHVLSPVAASPLVWPAQEATRQAAQLAANGWNEWLNWSGHMADAGRTLFNGAGPRVS